MNAVISNTKFSVVIPAFRASATIERTLDSIAAQTRKCHEIIIVDDNSEDIAILTSIVDSERYAGLNIRLEASKTKLNGAGARNRGIGLSTGDFICFLDDDDEWLPRKLERVEQEINDIGNRGVEKFVIFSRTHIYRDGHFLKTMPALPPGNAESIAEYVFGCYGFTQTSTLVLAREHAAAIRFDERFKRHQDYDFCIRADRMGFAFIMIDEPLGRYHLRSSAGGKEKGESVDYSYYWLDCMRKYLSTRDMCTYKAYKLPERYRQAGMYLRAILVFLFYFPRTSTRNQFFFIKRTVEKMMSIFARRENS